MNRAHWDATYRQRGSTQVSWYSPHLGRSLEVIRRQAPSLTANIIDVGGGAATLVDDLLDAGYRSLTVLDISPAALQIARERLGTHALPVTWIDGDVTQMELPQAHYDLWHDRAVFHFLTDADQRRRYVARLKDALKSGGIVVLATFATDGPEKCSGLPVARYDAPMLAAALGADFRLIDTFHDVHLTPGGKEQRFLYAILQKQATPSEHQARP